MPWGLRRAEVPFFVPISDAFVEGEIDLLCTDDAQLAGARALVVDYKTGGSDGEAPEALCSKHLLQAQCYAYALLRQGCVEVELRFARVERPEPPHEDGTAAAAGPGEPQAVSYRFARPDLEDLRARRAGPSRRPGLNAAGHPPSASRRPIVPHAPARRDADGLPAFLRL